MKFFNNLSMKWKLVSVFLVMGFLVAFSIGYASYQTAAEALHEEGFNKMISVREAKAFQIEQYFSQIQNQLKSFSENPVIIDAIQKLDECFEKIDKDLKITEEKMKEIDQKLLGFYSGQFVPKLNANSQSNHSASSFLPQDTKSRILQFLYIVSNSNEVGQKHLLDDAGDGSCYSEVHKKIHPYVRGFLEKFGFLY